MALVSINPTTGKKVGAHRSFTAKQIAEATTRAQRAFLGWRELSPAHRAKHLRALARTLRKQSEELAALAATEMGKPLADGKAEVEKCALGCEFYAKHGPVWLKEERPPGASPQAHVQFDPLGVVLAIMPWNFPYWQVFRAAAPALMAGNTMLLKHASNVTGCALAIERVFRDASVPQGVFQTLPVSSKAIPALIGDVRVAGITLTGSTAAGQKVAELAGAALKPCVLELGGSDAYLVLDDADLDQAAEICATARLQNAGQSCICAKRFIVVDSVQREFTQKLVARMAARPVGDPFDPTTKVGPLARLDLREELHAQVTASVQRGAKLLLGGKIPSGPGSFYPPTVLTNVRKGMPAHDEELFGPVAAVIAVRDEEAAIAVANASIYGLGAGIFSRNRRRARDIAGRLEAGNVFVNDFVKSDPALPFGGVKQSGFGRELGVWGLRSFVNIKTVRIA